MPDADALGVWPLVKPSGSIAAVADDGRRVHTQADWHQAVAGLADQRRLESRHCGVQRP